MQANGLGRRAASVVLGLSLLLLPAAVAREAPATLEGIGTGALLAKTAAGLVPLPILDMRVDIDVTGVMVRGMVEQSFRNPTDEVIEALYIFPLPEKAAVDAMEMRLGDRLIRAVVREKEEARATYEGAKREGRKAALLDQGPASLFTASAANINPGETITVRLRYLEEAVERDGEVGVVFPLTFTPRYRRATPAAADGGLAPEEPRDERLALAQSVPAPRAAIDVRLEAGVALEGITSPSHAIRAEADGAAWRVRLDGGPVEADRDFVLRWRPERGERPGARMFVEERAGERYALLLVRPPDPRSAAGEGLPTETVFVIDVSGSMAGSSMEQARRALRRALDRLRPGDAFNIIRFNDTHEALSERLLPARAAEIDEARAWVEALRAGGGTEIAPALARGLRMLADADPWPARRLILITDGAVEDEDTILAETAALLGTSRLHLIGIGSAPNRHLVRRLAALGRGASEIIGDLAEVEPRADAFLSRIDRPVMAGLTLQWEEAPPAETYPQRLPDLYAGEPLVVSLRLGAPAGATRAVLAGELAGGPLRLALDVASEAAPGSGVATRWARARVEDLVDGLALGADEPTVRREVIATALGFDLVTRYTSLVAVEEYPSAEGACRTHGVAGVLPHGSTFPGGMLPQTGTSGPLFLIVGLTLVTIGSLAAWLGRLER